MSFKETKDGAHIARNAKQWVAVFRKIDAKLMLVQYNDENPANPGNFVRTKVSAAMFDMEVHDTKEGITDLVEGRGSVMPAEPKD